MNYYIKTAGNVLQYGLFAGALTLVTASAHAASIAFFLDQSNVLPDGNNYLQITIDDEGLAGAINFKVQAIAPLTGFSGYNFGIQQFGFNSLALGVDNISGLPDNWKLKHDKKMNEFGKFENILVGKKWHREDTLMFSIIGIEGDNIYSYANSHDGENGFFYSAYVGGFGHDGKCKKSGDCFSKAYFAGGSPVPVPAAVWLFGSGLLGLLGFVRRKSRLEQKCSTY